MSIVTLEDVEKAISALELGWWEAWQIRRFYGVDLWSRTKANLTVRLVWWVLVGGVALAFMAYVLLVLAFAIKEVL